MQTLRLLRSGAKPRPVIPGVAAAPCGRAAGAGRDGLPARRGAHRRPASRAAGGIGDAA